MIILLRALVVAVLLGNSVAAAAHEDELLDAAFAGVSEIGKQWNGEVNAATQALYMPLHRVPQSAGLRARVRPRADYR